LEKFLILTPVLAVALLPGWALGQNEVQDFHARFIRDTDSMHRARMMPQLEEAEFQAIAKDTDDGKFPEALALLQEYRDEIETCEKDLDAKHIDAEKHPNGFKQLQFALRASLRHLDALLVSFTEDEKMPFLKLRGDLEQLDRHLIRKLFPSAQNGNPILPD
jgi:hypothetical protein